jgi:hypothetical protein
VRAGELFSNFAKKHCGPKGIFVFSRASGSCMLHVSYFLFDFTAIWMEWVLGVHLSPIGG